MSADEHREASDMSGFGRGGSGVDDTKVHEQDATERMNPLARAGWWCISKLTAPVTATKYSVGQCVEIDGDRYLVRRVLTPEPFDVIREPKVILERVGGGHGIQRRQMAERVLDLYREGRIGSREEAEA